MFVIVVISGFVPIDSQLNDSVHRWNMSSNLNLTFVERFSYILGILSTRCSYLYEVGFIIEDITKIPTLWLSSLVVDCWER